MLRISGAGAESGAAESGGWGSRVEVLVVSHEDPRRAGAAARAAWPVAQYALGQEPADDLRATTTPSERVAMVWRIMLDAWAAMGDAIPDYPRDKTPRRVIRP